MNINLNLRVRNVVRGYSFNGHVVVLCFSHAVQACSPGLFIDQEIDDFDSEYDGRITHCLSCIMKLTFEQTYALMVKDEEQPLIQYKHARDPNITANRVRDAISRLERLSE